MEDTLTITERPIGPVIREVRIALNGRQRGAALSVLRRDLERQTQRQWHENVVYAALSYLQGDEAECRAGIWFPEQNWARTPEPN
jgi:hypothetical protein